MLDSETEALLAVESLPAFKVTPLAASAAVPNLLAEVLHPHAHWSHSLENDL